mmetsp:Transcript_6491/g.9990  ORF Transcript_6491/g.9990 Transcript_6491/m.9990 type:complete len:402 (-) Transcript_6491:765-1970(-)
MASQGVSEVGAKSPAAKTPTANEKGNGIASHLGLNAFFNDPKKNEFQKALAERKEGDRKSKKDTEAQQFDEDAANEHSWGDVPLCASPEELLINHRLGSGVMWYFKFSQFIIKYNLLLVIIALISWVPSLIVGPRYEDMRYRWPSTWYLSTYDGKVYPAYVVAVTLMLLLTFCLGPAYRQYVMNYLTKQKELREKAAAQGGDVKWVEDQFQGRYGREQYDFVDETAVDWIEYDVPITTRYNRVGLYFSYFVMASILLLSGIITFYMQRAARQAGGNTLASFCIALFVSALGMTWEYMCYILTWVEKWAYWSDYWKSATIKVLLFKILNIFTVFLVKRIEYQADNSDGGCQLRDLGDQFLLLVALNSASTIGNLAYVVIFTDKNSERQDGSLGNREFVLAVE